MYDLPAYREDARSVLNLECILEYSVAELAEAVAVKLFRSRNEYARLRYYTRQLLDQLDDGWVDFGSIPPFGKSQ